MLGLFTNSIIVTIVRPKRCSMSGTAISKIRIDCEDTLNFIWPRHAIEIKGLGTNDPTLAFKIDNLNDFVDWARETKGLDLKNLKSPYDFAIAAMFAALDALIKAPADARSGELARSCLSAMIDLGTVVKPRRRKWRKNAEGQPRFYSTELTAWVRHDADAEWNWAETPD